MKGKKGGDGSANEASANTLGASIRRRRGDLQLSLSDLAALSGVSAAMLSAVERGGKSPTIRVLSHIAEALACTISDLLDEPESPRPRVTRAASRKRVIDPESGIERVSLAGVAPIRDLDVVLYRLPPGTDTGSFAPHRTGVVEHVVVVRGQAVVHVGDTVVTLEADDSVTYAADASHRYRNEGTSTADLLLVIDASQTGRAREG